MKMYRVLNMSCSLGDASCQSALFTVKSELAGRLFVHVVFVFVFYLVVKFRFEVIEMSPSFCQEF